MDNYRVKTRLERLILVGFEKPLITVYEYFMKEKFLSNFLRTFVIVLIVRKMEMKGN